jgi:hypothetical protein
MPYISGMVIFAVSDSVEAAAITAFIAGFFSVVNTVINARNAKALNRVEQRQERAMEVLGERSEDESFNKSSREVGRTRTVKKERRRRRSS